MSCTNRSFHLLASFRVLAVLLLFHWLHCLFLSCFSFSSAFLPWLECPLHEFSALVFAWAFVPSIPVCSSFFLSVGWVDCLSSLSDLFFGVLVSSASFCRLRFSFPVCPPLRFLLNFPVVVLFVVVMSLLSQSLLFVIFFWLLGVSLFCLGRISGSLRDGVLPLGRVSCCLASLHSL